MANRYWRGGTGNWSDTSHWSTSSGGAGGASLPTSSDNVFIDSNSGLSGGTITIDANVIFNNFVSNSGFNYTITNSYNGIRCYGSLSLESGISYTSFITLESLSSGNTITLSGMTFGNLNIYGTGSWTLQDNLNITGEFYQENGTFNANNHNITANDYYFFGGVGFTPTINMGSGIWIGTGYGDVWVIDEATVNTITVNPGTSTIKFTNTSSNTKLFDISENTIGKVYNNLLLTGSVAGNPDYIINGSNTFNQLTINTPSNVIQFQNGTTTKIVNFTAMGSAGHLITIESDNSSPHFLTGSGTSSSNYLSIFNSHASPGNVWYAGANSVDSGGNTGWIFGTKPTPFSNSNNYFGKDY